MLCATVAKILLKVINIKLNLGKSVATYLTFAASLLIALSFRDVSTSAHLTGCHSCHGIDDDEKYEWHDDGVPLFYLAHDDPDDFFPSHDLLQKAVTLHEWLPRMRQPAKE